MNASSTNAHEFPDAATAEGTRAIGTAHWLTIDHKYGVANEGHNLFGDYEITLEAPDRSASVIVRYRTKDSDR